MSGLFQQVCPASGFVLGGHAPGAELGCEGDIVPVDEVHLGPAWAVGRVVPIVVLVQVALVVARSLELPADPALTIIPAQAVGDCKDGCNGVSGPVVEVVWGGGKMATG